MSAFDPSAGSPAKNSVVIADLNCAPAGRAGIVVVAGAAVPGSSVSSGAVLEDTGTYDVAGKNPGADARLAQKTSTARPIASRAIMKRSSIRMAVHTSRTCTPRATLVFS